MGRRGLHVRGHVSSQQESVLLAEGTGALARGEREGRMGVKAVSILRAWGSWETPILTMAVALPGRGSLLGAPEPTTGVFPARTHPLKPSAAFASLKAPGQLV